MKKKWTIVFEHQQMQWNLVGESKLSLIQDWFLKFGTKFGLQIHIWNFLMRVWRMIFTPNFKNWACNDHFEKQQETSNYSKKLEHKLMTTWILIEFSSINCNNFLSRLKKTRKWLYLNNVIPELLPPIQATIVTCYS